MLCPLPSPVEGLSTHPAHRRAPGYQLPNYSSYFLLDPSGPEPWPWPVYTSAVPLLRAGLVPSILMWLLAHSGALGSFRPPPVRLHLHHSNLSCFFQTHHIPGFPLLCLPVLCLKSPSLSPLAASLPGFVISLGSPPPCCSVHVQLPQNPSAQDSAYPPKFQTSSETPCLPVSLRILASLKSEFLVCVSVDRPCTSKCLAPGGIYICSVNSQQTLSLL